MTLQEAINKIASLQVEQWEVIQELKAMVGAGGTGVLNPNWPGASNEKIPGRRFKAVPDDLKAKAELLLKQGKNYRMVANATGLSHTSVVRIKKRMTM